MKNKSYLTVRFYVGTEVTSINQSVIYTHIIKLCGCLSVHCKNFPKRYAWLSVTFLGFISFEQVAGNNGFRPLKRS